MGILDRLFGVKPKQESRPAGPAAKATGVKPASPAKPKPAQGAAKAIASAPAQKAPAASGAAVKEKILPPAEEAAEKTVRKAAEEAPAPDAAEEADKILPPAEEAAKSPVPPAEAPWGEAAQKRLDTYFARLRQEFPDGEITRLNTAHKKLAERGAQLRRLIGYDGKLDEFFALGGFTYRRGVGGRPALPAVQTASVEERLRERFPEDVPTVLAVKQADARLYLDLRAAARRQGCTAGEFLKQFKE